MEQINIIPLEAPCNVFHCSLLPPSKFRVWGLGSLRVQVVLGGQSAGYKGRCKAMQDFSRGLCVYTRSPGELRDM